MTKGNGTKTGQETTTEQGHPGHEYERRRGAWRSRRRKPRTRVVGRFPSGERILFILFYVCAIRIIVFFSVQFEFFSYFLCDILLNFTVWVLLCRILLCDIKIVWNYTVCYLILFRLLELLNNLFQFFTRHILSQFSFLY